MIAAAAVVLIVVLVCGVYVYAQRAELAQQRWLREFEAAQKPQVELVALKNAVEARLVELERENRNTQLGKLGR